ncbi:MAG: peptidoglycan-binding domain-containing protein [Terriglobales bacterium]
MDRRGRRLGWSLAILAALLAGGAAVAPRALAAPPPARCCRKPRHRGRAGISPARARQIQAALVKAGYLRHVTGHWNWATHEALVRYQRDHHWQTRWVPDSRALIALGVGPKRDEPSAPRASARTAAAQSAAPHPARGGAPPRAASPPATEKAPTHGHL